MGAVGVEDFAQWEAADAAAGVGGGKTERILVSVRVRPLSAKELAANDPCDWECINDSTVIYRNNLPERAMPPTAYTFDRVFRHDCLTKTVYEEGAKEVALSVVSGVNATIFAYGQTSSGKTYTMSGITEYTVTDIYDYINKHEERAFVLKFSAIEIYNEAVKDLLSTDCTPLRLLDDPEKGTIVEKLTEEIVRDWNHLKALIAVCEAQRKIGETSLNEASSRSHQILRLTVESSAHEFLGKDDSSTLVANVNFVDLAGSERASQALSAGTRLKEGCHINRSLLTLGTVIRKLSKGSYSHIPYRDSKLTRILQPALGGNARTAIICTICPARSHIEQSRNTLLFASCAKEVTTNAQVNVVMSDKALVKHLQKELARLESELRYPGLSPNLEALLMEKDAQIKKMENEIKELIQQRDLAHSRLESLLKTVDTDRVSGRRECYSQISTPIAPYTCEDRLSSFGTTDDIYHTLESVSAENSTLERRHYREMQKKCITRPEQGNIHSICTRLAGNQFEEHMDQNYCEGYEDNCKEVRCIEMHEIARDAPSDLLLTEGHNTFPRVNMTSDHRKENDRPDGQLDLAPLDNNNMTLEQHLQNVRKKFPDGLSPWSSVDNLPSSRSLPLRRSRSCRSTLMSLSSWPQDLEHNGTTPPSRFLKDFPGRPEGFSKRISVLNYDAEIGTLSREGSQSSKFSTSSSLQKPQKLEVSEGEITRISDFVTELKELAQVQYQKQFLDDQGTKWNAIEENGDSASSKDVRLDTVLLPVQSPSQWPKEFGKNQQEIIELWHECNVSLVHRTYFFILFKGDPMDLIYTEVELRRLSFLKNALTRGNPDKTTTLGHVTTSESSKKKLRREREMLCRQMHKRLSSEERESLYSKWRIALVSKQRGMQLARRLWADTKDMEHVRESASTVAKVIGLSEHSQALKEMFGLSFTPQQASRRSRSWLHGLSSRR